MLSTSIQLAKTKGNTKITHETTTPRPLLSLGSLASRAVFIDPLSLRDNIMYQDAMDSFLRDDLVPKLSKITGIKDIHNTTAELWEIFQTFGLTKKHTVIFPGHNDRQAKFIKDYHGSTIGKAGDLAVVQYTSQNLPEFAALLLLSSHIPVALKGLKKSGTAIFQFQSLETRSTLNLIYYLANQFESAELYRPAFTSDIYDTIYFIGTGYAGKSDLQEPPPSSYIRVEFPPSANFSSLDSAITCYNIDHNTAKESLTANIWCYLQKGIILDEYGEALSKRMTTWADNYSGKKVKKSHKNLRCKTFDMPEDLFSDNFKISTVLSK